MDFNDDTTLTAVGDDFGECDLSNVSGTTDHVTHTGDREKPTKECSQGNSAVDKSAPQTSSGAAADSGETGDGEESLVVKLRNAFDALSGHERKDGFSKLVEKGRVVVTVERLLDLFGGECREKGCVKMKEVQYKCEGGVGVISWSCGGGHCGQWETSDVLCEKGRGQKVYVNTVLLAASILVSGNNFDKVSLLSRCLNLNFIGRSTFSRIQKLYAVPAIRTLWEEMKEAMEKVFQKEELVLGGDGRNDSPGFCAQYCVYSVMEELTKVIVDVEVKDKRETGGSSPAMEVAALKVILERLVEKYKLGELTTDASSSVIALVKKLKGTFFYN